MIDLTKPLNLDVEHLEFLSDLQGNILKGHGRSYAIHLLLRFDTKFVNTAKAWIRHFAGHRVTSALDQYLASHLRKARISGRTAGEEELFSMVLLSAEGYRFLGKEMPNTSNAFSDGMANRELLQDPAQSEWEESYQGQIHAMVLLAHDDYDTLNAGVRLVEKQLNRFCEMVHREEGKRLTRAVNGRETIVEPFGYVDSISQPLFIQHDINEEVKVRGNSHWDPGASLDLVVIEEQQGSNTYGSFMVFRKLEQNVSRFYYQIDQLAKGLGVDGDTAGAYIVGRYPDGRSLADTAARSTAGSLPNDFNFEDDADGKVCPLHAHIRKTNPRSDLKQMPDQIADGLNKAVRIVRRGIPYDQRPEYRKSTMYEQLGRPEHEVGLLFMSFQANLEDFEILQQRANSKDFVKTGVGVDAIIGQPGTGSRELGPVGATGNMTWDDVVTLKGGEYFFAPSLPMLQSLEVRPLDTGRRTLYETVVEKLFVTEPDTLQEVGPLWAEGKRLEAMALVGIGADEFDDFYAYLVPLMPLLDPYTSGPYEVQMAQVAVEENGPSPREKAANALTRLLDPDELQKFSLLWSENSDEALAYVGLSREDNDAFYAYLEQFGLNLNLLFWW